MTCYLIFFIIGLFFGSFLNIVICRFPKMKGVLWGRSYCPKCKKIIPVYDLLPLVSYIILGGKCRFCKKTISVQYPLVELATGFLFVLACYIFGFDISLIFYLPIFMLLVLIFSFDLKYLEIPEVFSWLFLIFAIIIGFAANIYTLDNFLLGGLVGGGILGILVGISNEQWMGSGDIKIGLGFGFLLGFPRALLFVFLSFILGAIFGIIVLALKKGILKSQLPFAPFLIISALICLMFGEKIIEIYSTFAII